MSASVLATVTVTVRDDPANENGVNVVVESDPSYPLGPGAALDVDNLTNAQAVTYVMLEELAKIAPGIGRPVTLITPDVPDAPPA